MATALFWVFFLLQSVFSYCVSAEEIFTEETPHPTSIPVLKEEAELYLDMRYEFEGISLYATLPQFTIDITEVQPYYSLDNNQYYPIDSPLWGIDQEELGKNRRSTVYATQSPLKEYLNEEIDVFYIRFKIVGGPYEGWSKIAVMQRPLPEAVEDLPAGFTSAAWFAPEVRVLQYRPLRIHGMMHFTVLSNSTDADKQALLPSRVATEIQIMEEMNTIWKTYTDYEVTWPDLSTLPHPYQQVQASTLLRNESIIFEMSGKNYRIANIPQINDTEPLFVQFNEIDEGYVSELFLSDNDNHLWGTLPLKPTGSTRITIDYSYDQQTWISKELDLTQYPIDAIANQESYTFKLFNADETPMLDYNNGNVEAFFIKLTICDSAYSTTEISNWPQSFTYVPPPSIPNDNDGSGGNRGNVNSDNGNESERESTEQQNTNKKETEIVVISIPKEEPSKDTLSANYEQNNKLESVIPTLHEVKSKEEWKTRSTEGSLIMMGPFFLCGVFIVIGGAAFIKLKH